MKADLNLTRKRKGRKAEIELDTEIVVLEHHEEPGYEAALEQIAEMLMIIVDEDEEEAQEEGQGEALMA